MKSKLEKEMLDAMSKNPIYWKGILYVNRKDPRLVVPKLYPQMGWTFNFASIYTYLVIIAFILVLVAARYLK